MLTGQAVKDWSDRIEHLAHGFGATSCRVTIARRAGYCWPSPAVIPLAVPLPALPIPEEASVGPVEIGKREDGTPVAAQGPRHPRPGRRGHRGGQGLDHLVDHPRPAARCAGGPGRRSGRWIPS